MSTVKTPFGRGIPLVHLDQDTPIPSSFVLQLPHKLTPSDIGDGLSQTVVFDHILDLQTLDTDRLVLTDQLCRELLLVITASVTDASVYSSHLETSLIAVLGTFFLLGKTPLGLRQLLLILVEEFGVAMSLSLGGDHHRLQAQIKSHLFVDYWQMLDVLFDQDGDKVASSGIFGDGHTRGFDTLGQGARPVNVKGGVHLGKGKLFPVPLEGRRHIRSGLHPLFLMELGILSPPFKEVTESSIKVAQGLLKRDTGDFIEPGCLFFEQGELC